MKEILHDLGFVNVRDPSAFVTPQRYWQLRILAT